MQLSGGQFGKNHKKFKYVLLYTLFHLQEFTDMPQIYVQTHSLKHYFEMGGEKLSSKWGTG